MNLPNQAQLPIPDETSELQNDEESGEKNELQHLQKVTKLFKKNSLKFSRRLCRSALLYLDKKPFISKVVKQLTSITMTQLLILKGIVLDEQKLSDTLRLMLISIWKSQRDTLTYWKNKKISLITVLEWESIFSFNGFCDRIQNQLPQLYRLLVFEDANLKEIFTFIFSKIIFTFHKMILNTLLFTEVSMDTDFSKKVTNRQDFMIMVSEPWLYRHYNHTRGKFAIECCGKCKICRSSFVPSDFLDGLSQARERFEVTSAFYRAMMLDVNVMTEEQLNILLTFWGQNSRKR